jgi:CBS domain-containing membrane protein
MKNFRTLLAGGDLATRILAAIGAGGGIFIVSFICAAIASDVIGLASLPYLLAPVAATAVLLFVVPASPMAQPWPVIGGTVVSTVLGVIVYQGVDDAMLASALAVGGSIALMALLRAMHPPGCAAALTAVIGPEGLHQFGFGAAIFPLGANALLLVGCAYIFHKFSGHRYPHRAEVAIHPVSAVTICDQDVEVALAAQGEIYDIDHQDLRILVQLAVESALNAKKVK